MATSQPQDNTKIRNISQTVQERTIVKTAPDIVVYLDGLPYLLNYFVKDQKTDNTWSIVNFNDHVTGFNAGYDTDIMIPNATITLQVPNYLKHLYQMPGGNNLIQTMMEIQVFAKGYFLANNGDTVYRRVFKGLVSHIGYSDNGKTVDISIQCYGSMHFLELMQINIHPSVQTAVSSGVNLTVYQSIMGHKNPYLILQAMLAYSLDTAGFQQVNLGAPTPTKKNSIYSTSVANGYISKWQEIMRHIATEVHIYGTAFKDNLDKSKVSESEVRGSKAKHHKAAQSTLMAQQYEYQQQDDLYYNQIRQYQPEMTITDLSLLNNKIISRMEYIRQILHIINFEGYQDLDGKIIIKPPLYNLDVTNLGPRNQQTSATPDGTGDANTSASNPLTEIYEQTNPFVIYLDEILTENETEDQSAIKKTRTTVCGNINPAFNVGFDPTLLSVAEYIDIGKLQKFGLREEPTIQVPWIQSGSLSLFAHAVAETVRANRGYRTYTVSIPMRPELKLGFPIYFPHKDMYGYIKSVNIAYQIGATATMTITCDSLRRRVLIPTTQNNADGKTTYTKNTSAPDLIYKWVKDPQYQPQQSSDPNAVAEAGNNLQYLRSMETQAASGTAVQGTKTSQVTPNNPVGQPVTTPSTKELAPSQDDSLTQTARSKKMGSSWTMQPDTPYASYVVANDTFKASTPKDAKSTALNTQQSTAAATASGTGIYKSKRPVDSTYFTDIQRGNIPFTDGKGYEVLAPFPWGRYQDLKTAIKEFTMDGYIVAQKDLNGQPVQNQQDISVLNTTDAFLFAGLGTPTATQHPSDQLVSALAQLQNQADMDTVIVLDYSNAQNSNDQQLLNVAQPDISNKLSKSFITNTQAAQQQLINVLVTGSVQPVQNARQALEEATTPSPYVVGAGNNPPGTGAPSIVPGSASNSTGENAVQLDQFKGD